MLAALRYAVGGLFVVMPLQGHVSGLVEFLQPCLTSLTLGVPGFSFILVPLLPHHVVVTTICGTTGTN